MAVFMFFLFLFSLHGVEAQTNHYNISLGSSISPASSNSSWLSPSGLYAFGFYKEGNGFAVGVFLAGIPDKTVVWTANRDQDHVVPNDATLLLTTDGRLIHCLNCWHFTHCLSHLGLGDFRGSFLQISQMVRNLVRLVGYCIDGPTRLLVYQFMERGSLADVLFNQENRLSWMERVGIATDIARGLRYQF